MTPIRHLYRRRDIDVYIGGQLRLQALVSQTEACLRLFLTHTRRANRPRFRDITRVHITLRAAGLDRDFERAESARECMEQTAKRVAATCILASD